MSALYAMKYQGQAGTGLGTLYVGRNKIVGTDVGGGRYSGTYTDQNGRMKGAVLLSFPSGGVLVTGLQMQPNSSLPLSFDWPSNFGSGAPQQIMVAGNPVGVAFEKIGDIP